MFGWLGQSISRAWPMWLAMWVGLLVVTWALAPPWSQVAVDQDDTLLKPNTPSRQAEQLFHQAFPDNSAGSNIAIVLHRPDSQSNVEADKQFVQDVLEPALRKATGLGNGIKKTTDDSPFESDSPPLETTGPILRLRTPNAKGAGDLLVSPDNKAMLVVLELNTGFLAEANSPIAADVEKAIDEARSNSALPAGLHLDVTGSAVVGRDQHRAEREGARSTEKLTITLVVILLVLIYRAPLLSIIPLITVVAAVEAALFLLAILAGKGWIGLFPGIQTYITILAYGAGVDFTLFLIARYKENLDAGRSVRDSITAAVSGVGATVTASAFTVICGLGTLVLAEFGKFRQAGTAIALALTLVWLAALTFSPALLCLAGRWTFWPRNMKSLVDLSPEMSPAISDPCGDVHRTKFRSRWEWVIGKIVCRPATVLAITSSVLAPFAILAILLNNHVNYNLVTNLPSSCPSVVGTKALEKHFPSGMTGPVSILVVDRAQDFRKPAGRELIATVTERLHAKQDELSLADIRSLKAPLGFGQAASNAARTSSAEDLQSASVDSYVGGLGERAAQAMRLDFVLKKDPFADVAIDTLYRIETFLKAQLPASAEIYTMGTTATIRDLESVMQRDRGRIEKSVLLAVFAVLVLLLRQFIVPVYLLLSVLLSYYAALGVTFLVFWALDPSGFVGLDWKVTVFLFAILIAVGEDYNIFLVSRVAEEQEKFGPIRGVSEALVRTGPIISSCGVIMAGTFASLMAGTLKEMQQLGFALAFGVLLDTFVVRPVLVPAFLVIFYGRKRARSERAHGRELIGAK